MADVKHTPEPWRLEEDSYSSGFRGANDFYVGGIEAVAEVDKANARRIVAAVNACVGIPTEELESGSIRSLDAVYRTLGWQGGTIHQVVRRIESLVRLEKEVGADALAKLEGRVNG
jgi:hypothetical protein